MILPIVAYGTPILREKCQEIDAGYPNLGQLIADMWETMYHTNGVGLAAPQVNRNIRLFVIDSEQIFNNQEPDEKGRYPDEPGSKQVFINAQIVKLEKEEWSYNEGCLSIPKIREDISRSTTVTIRYHDEQFQQHEKTFIGVTGRIILHEYDHIEGKLFIDYLSALKRRLLKGKLDDISKGRVKVDYRMHFPR
jgi:peptide deformylase